MPKRAKLWPGCTLEICRLRGSLSEYRIVGRTSARTCRHMDRPIMGGNVIVWDLETGRDLKGFAVANGHDGKSDDDVRIAMGDKFPKHLYHSIVCIGALLAHQDDGHWAVDAL